MWSEPRIEVLRQMPGLYATEGVKGADKVVHHHFFIGGCDWYALEFDGRDVFFGFAILNGDLQNAEFGNFSLSELRSVNLGGIEIDHDEYWEPKPLREIGKFQISRIGQTMMED